MPCSLVKFGLAPAFSSSAAISRLHRTAAQASAVAPSSSRALTSTLLTQERGHRRPVVVLNRREQRATGFRRGHGQRGKPATTQTAARVRVRSLITLYTSRRFSLPVLSPSFSVGTPTLSSIVRYRFVNGVVSPGYTI